MNKNIIEMLNLQGLLVDKICTKSDELIVKCRSPRIIAICPDCLNRTKKVHQRHVRIKKHGKVFQRIVWLQLTIRRFRCKRCRSIFTEDIPGISKCKTSDNFERSVLELLSRNSLSWVAKQYQTSVNTLINRLLKWQVKRKIDWLAMTDNIILGIDEHSFRGKRMLTVITDLKNKKLLAILRNDSQKELIKFFNNMPDLAKKRVIEVCMDLRFSYRSCLEKLFPQANIVADRFHVELQAKRALDQLRAVIQIQEAKKYNLKKLLFKYNDQLDDYERKRLNSIWQRYQKYPSLKELYIAKEHIRQIYYCKNKNEARKQLKHCLMLLETAHYSVYILTLKKTLKRWQEQILNYYDNKTTNGFTEGCNNKIKMVKRMSFGFTKVEHYIAKMLLAFTPLFFGGFYHTV